MAKVLEGNEYKSYIMAILASALFSEDTKVPVTLTDYIYDPTLGKFQNEINAEVSDPKTVTVFVFKSTANETNPNVIPNSPTGGSWDMTTDILQLPEGWTTNDELDAPVWLSYGVFGVKNGESTLIQDWSTPIRISGVDGIDGKDGNGYTYIYARTENSDTLPAWVEGWSINQALDSVWTDSPKGITENLQAEWVAILPDTTDENPNPKWQGPVLWSKWGVNGKDGDGIEYIYCVSKLQQEPSINHLVEDDQQKREYVPKGETGTGFTWTDSPTGVNKDIPYEWVSIRKFKHETQTWGTFSDAKIWAKYGEKGESGQSVWIAYNDSEEQPVGPNNTIDLGNGWYFADKATENNKPVWWCLKISQTVEGGTWGPVLKLNGKDGTSVTIKSSLNSEDDLCSIEDSEIGDSYLIGENLYIRVESESEGVKTCGNGTYWKNAGVIKGPKGDSQYLHIRYADRIECDESNVCKYIFTEPDGTQPGRYLGTYVSNYKSADEDRNITVSTAYSWYDTKGEQGVPGAASEFYTLSANTNVIIKKSNGEYDPVNIIPYLKHVKGNVTSLLTAIPEGYGLFYWNNKNEGEDKWERYTDLGEGLGIPVNSLNEKIKFKLLRDSDSDNDYELVDELEVPIVADGSDAYTIVYSDQNVAIECDSFGTPVDLEPRNVEIRVMKGSLYVNIKSGDTSVEYITVTIDPDKLESVTTVFPGTLLLLDGTELNYSINAIKVQPGKPAQNPIYIQTSQTSVLYECGIEPESGEYYLKSPVRAVELTFTLYEGLTQQTFSTNLDVEIESLSSSKTPFDSILEKYKLDTENKTLTVTIPNLSNDENLKNYGDFKITVSDIYNDKDVYAEVYVDFYIQEGVITKPLFAFTKTNDDISNLPLTGLNTKETYTLPISEGYTWSSNTNITGNGQLWKAEGLAEIRKTSTETTYNVTWYKPYMLLDNDSREIIYTDKKDKESIPSIKTYGGPTAEWFDACNAVNWYDDTVDSNGNTFEAMWMATNDKKSNQDWDDKNWVFSLLYNDNITYKIVTDLSSQPTPGYTSFTANAIKLINGILDNTFTPNDYKLEVKVGDNIITPISDYYNAEFTLGEIITIKLFVNNALVEIFTAKVSKGDKGDPGDKGDKGDDGDKGDPGNDGKDACQINIDKPVVTFITDETQGFTINDTNVTVCIQVYKGGVKHNIALTYLKINYKLGDNIESSSGEIIYNHLSSNGSCVITRTITNGNLYIDINVSGGVNVSDIFEYIDINYKVEGLGINTNTKISSIFVPQGSRGEVGPMGETGPLMYPAGEWKAQAYSITNNTAPYVYYKDTKKYYVLQKNCSSLIKPTNTSYWTEITQYEAIWTKVLMANFANIASAVFWGNYMFSEQGVTKDGILDTLQGDNYAYYAESMFDANENLSETFIPNLLIDFNKGYLRTNYLLDSYLTIPDMSHNNNYYHNNLVIDLNNYSIYNIKIQPRFSGDLYVEFIGMTDKHLSNNQSSILASGYLNYSTALICMPTIVENYKNGLTSKIIYEIPIEPKKGELLEAGPYYNPNLGGSGLVIVCADNFILNKDKNESDSWFIKNGEKFKFILLSSGTILSLKLMIVEKSKTEKINYWYIENTDDFAPVTATIARWVQPDNADTNKFYDVNFVATSGVNESTYNIHDYLFLGSKQLSYLSILSTDDSFYSTGSSWGTRQFEFDLMYHAIDINDGDFTKYGYKPGWYIHNKNRGNMVGIYSQDPIIKLNSNSLPTWKADAGVIKICRPAFIGQFLILSNSIYIGTELYSYSYGSGNNPWTLISSTN